MCYGHGYAHVYVLLLCTCTCACTHTCYCTYHLLLTPRSLHDLLKEHRAGAHTDASNRWLPEPKIVDYFRQLCLAMQHVHQRKVRWQPCMCVCMFISGS